MAQDYIGQSDHRKTSEAPLVFVADLPLSLWTVFRSRAGVPSLASLSLLPWVLEQGRASQQFPSFLSWDGNPAGWGAPEWSLNQGGGSVTTLLPKVTQPPYPHPSPGNLVTVGGRLVGWQPGLARDLGPL